MSTARPENPHPRPLIAPAAVLREAFGLLCLLLGIVALLTAAYRTDLELGLAVNGLLGIGAALLLTIERT